MKRVWKKIPLFLLVALFALSSVMLLRYARSGRRQSVEFARLKAETGLTRRAVKPLSKETETQEDTVVEEPAPPEEYVSLYEENPDFWGWLEIEGTALNYPVMYTPEEPERYLRRDFAGEWSLHGVPFLDGRWREGSGNAIIYGHNMWDGTMFAPLHSYADREFWAEHSVISLDTRRGRESYTILAAFYARVYDREDEGVFRYYQCVDLSQPELFGEYVAQVKAAALYDTGVTAEFGDELLTLSTCSYHTENGRFVVVAKREREKICV